MSYPYTASLYGEETLRMFATARRFMADRAERRPLARNTPDREGVLAQGRCRRSGRRHPEKYGGPAAIS